MERTKKILMTLFWALILIALLIVICYELVLFLPGDFQQYEQANFTATMVMELLTVVLIPSSLYLFQAKPIHNSLIATPAPSLLRWGTLRLLMLGVPMVVNTLFYYWFANVSFGYMAIICLLCFFFIVPTRARCEQETREREEEQSLENE